MTVLDPNGATPVLSASERADFDRIAHIAYSEAGLMIPPEKAPMVFARLNKRLRALGIPERSDYCSLVSDTDQVEERHKLICALTTNVTSFFRESHHFDFIRQDLLPSLIDRARGGGRVRMWSAACSSGEEPFSLAIFLLEAMPDAANFDIRILATDIDSETLKRAQSGRYSANNLSQMDPSLRDRYFTADSPTNRDQKTYIAHDKLRRLISFRHLNLLGPWPMKQSFDIIMCRNVVIYFDQKTQNNLWPRFEKACSVGGHLFLGHSERIDTSVSHSFQTVGTTTYRRTDNTKFSAAI